MGHSTSPHQTLKAAVRNMPKLDMKTFHTKCLKDVEGCLVVAVVIAHNIISCLYIM